MTSGFTELAFILSDFCHFFPPLLGVFTAPVKGVYHFRFTAAAGISPMPIDIKMYKNEQRLFYNFGFNSHVWYEYISNGIILELEKGDNVDMRLPVGFKLYDDEGNHNMFSGYLVFPM